MTVLNDKTEYKLTIENFEGPLDLLIYLISKNKMNIFDISISQITDEYVAYLNEMTEQNLDAASEFIVMAATLLDIKARKLLPELEPKESEEEHSQIYDCILQHDGKGAAEAMQYHLERAAGRYNYR